MEQPFTGRININDMVKLYDNAKSNSHMCKHIELISMTKDTWNNYVEYMEYDLNLWNKPTEFGEFDMFGNKLFDYESIIVNRMDFSNEIVAMYLNTESKDDGRIGEADYNLMQPMEGTDDVILVRYYYSHMDIIHDDWEHTNWYKPVFPKRKGK